MNIPENVTWSAVAFGLTFLALGNVLPEVSC